MEKTWCHKTVQSLNPKEKDEIINMVFEACTDCEEFSDIGGEVFQGLSNRGCVWSEEIED